MAEHATAHAGENLGPVTLSAGISTLHAEPDSAAELLHRADKALYQAKTTGRNRVITAEV